MGLQEGCVIVKERVEVERWEMESQREVMVTHKNIECIKVNYVYSVHHCFCKKGR